MIAVTLPGAVDGGVDAPGTLGWLLDTLAAGRPPLGSRSLRVETAPAPSIGIAPGDGAKIAIPLPAAAAGEGVAVAPGVTLAACNPADAADFLGRHMRGLDHVGINLAQSDVDAAAWHGLVAAVAADAPAYRLEMPSANDIVLIVTEPADGPPAVLELVRDLGAARSSVHLCIAVDADRAAVERAFPAPCGGYKPGDEAWFRSVVLASRLGIDAYLDLAFSDGAMTPWPAIVAAMGRRIG